MSLVQFFKCPVEGFAFSDGAASIPEPRMVRSDCRKIAKVGNGLLLAAAGDSADSSMLLAKASELRSEASFRDALDFVRGCIAELRRMNGPSAPGPDSPHSLGVALMGFDSEAIRLIGWDGHSGKESEQLGEEANWSMAFDEQARLIAGGASILALEQYKLDRDVSQLVSRVESGYRYVSRLYPQRIGGNFYWARVGAEGRVEACVTEGGTLAEAQSNSAIDASGNLLLKNIAQSTSTNSTTTSTSMVAIPGVSQSITTRGNKVDVRLTGPFWIELGSGTGSVYVYRDGPTGVQLLIGEVGVTAPMMGTISVIDTPSAASHTYAAYWQTTAGTLRGDYITLQAVELG